MGSRYPALATKRSRKDGARKACGELASREAGPSAPLKGAALRMTNLWDEYKKQMQNKNNRLATEAVHLNGWLGAGRDGGAAGLHGGIEQIGTGGDGGGGSG